MPTCCDEGVGSGTENPSERGTAFNASKFIPYFRPRRPRGATQDGLWRPWPVRGRRACSKATGRDRGDPIGPMCALNPSVVLLSASSMIGTSPIPWHIVHREPLKFVPLPLQSVHCSIIGLYGCVIYPIVTPAARCDSKQAVLLIRRRFEIKRVLLCSALQCLPLQHNANKQLSILFQSNTGLATARNLLGPGRTHG